MSNAESKKVFVGMSGGVDSSVAAYLLKSAYYDSHGRVRISGGRRPEERYSRAYDVTGVFINGYNVDGCAERDVEDARRAAEHIGIPFYILDLREEYFQYVVEYMIDGYKRGLTPNPDVMCNHRIKFGVFLERALSLGADYIATGHYTRLREKFEARNPKSEILVSSRSFDKVGVNSKKRNSGLKIKEFKIDLKFKIKNLKFHLFEAKDGNKDQSYFLWTLTQEQLQHCLFPIGDYTKPEVREIAKKAGLPNAERKDSQGICFLGKVKLPDFLREYIKPKRGDVLDILGNKVGEHEGAQFYTIGQRHINVNFQFPISNFQINTKYQIPNTKRDRKPYYVVEKDVKKNVLIVAEGNDNPALFKREIELTDVNFIDLQILHSPIRANWRMDILARVRYRQPLVRAKLMHNDVQINLDKVADKKLKLTNLQTYKLIFDKPQKFIASGQSAVFYSKDGEMIGGGIINR